MQPLIEQTSDLLEAANLLGAVDPLALVVALRGRKAIAPFPNPCVPTDTRIALYGADGEQSVVPFCRLHVTNKNSTTKKELVFVLDKKNYGPILSLHRQCIAGAIPQEIHDRRNDMSNYEKQILATEQYYDREMCKIEQSGGKILSSVVPGSNLHQKIHNPVTEGIDEG
jgi:hypothetical protein